MSLILNSFLPERPPAVVSAEVPEAKTNLYGVARQHERGIVDFPVKIFAAGKTGHIMGRTNDLGLGGMAFYAPVQLPLDEEVRLHFSLPYSRMAFGIAAMVRSVNGFRYGVEFERLTAGEAAEIRRIVQILAAEK